MECTGALGGKGPAVFTINFVKIRHILESLVFARVLLDKAEPAFTLFHYPSQSQSKFCHHGTFSVCISFLAQIHLRTSEIARA